MRTGKILLAIAIACAGGGSCIAQGILQSRDQLEEKAEALLAEYIFSRDRVPERAACVIRGQSWNTHAVAIATIDK